MNRLLRADFYRIYHKKLLWLCASSMVLITIMFIIMQYTAMDYTVSIDRVIFLPMSFYGVAVAALISLFIGEDFSDGVIRNKLIAGRNRYAVYFSNMITGLTASLTVYIVMLVTSLGIGIHLFEINVTTPEIIRFTILGAFTCLAYGSIYCMLTMLIGNKTTAVTVSMILAFGMLFLCLHTNQIVVQPEYKDGLLNPHYATGIKRIIYELLHDINPSGQAAQLSAMSYLNAVRWIVIDILWVILTGGLGSILFSKKDIR